MPNIKVNVKLPDDATNTQIIDAFLKLQREMEWLLNGNLDEKNIRKMSFQSGTVQGDVTFEGNVNFGGANIGTVQNNSTATDVTQLRNDFNQLLDKLRAMKIIGGG
jgi:hypothetical protein